MEEGDGVLLHITVGPELKSAGAGLVTTAVLGNTAITKLPYENPDGSPLTVDTDYFGKKRNAQNPTPGPFENPDKGARVLKVW